MAYQSEIEKLQRRYDEKPEQWFAALADAYRKVGEIDVALEIVRSGIAERPNYVSGHIVLGRCLVDQSEDDEAKGVFEQVLILDAENIIALRVLGEVAERAGDLSGAKQWLDRLLEVDPMNDEARVSLERVAEAVEAESAARRQKEEASEEPVAESVESEDQDAETAGADASVQDEAPQAPEVAEPGVAPSATAEEAPAGFEVVSLSPPDADDGVARGPGSDVAEESAVAGLESGPGDFAGPAATPGDADEGDEFVIVRQSDPFGSPDTLPKDEALEADEPSEPSDDANANIWGTLGTEAELTTVPDADSIRAGVEAGSTSDFGLDESKEQSIEVTTDQTAAEPPEQVTEPAGEPPEAPAAVGEETTDEIPALTLDAISKREKELARERDGQVSAEVGPSVEVAAEAPAFDDVSESLPEYNVDAPPPSPAGSFPPTEETPDREESRPEEAAPPTEEGRVIEAAAPPAPPTEAPVLFEEPVASLTQEPDGAVVSGAEPEDTPEAPAVAQEPEVAVGGGGQSGPPTSIDVVSQVDVPEADSVVEPVASVPEVPEAVDSPEPEVPVAESVMDEPTEDVGASVETPWASSETPTDDAVEKASTPVEEIPARAEETVAPDEHVVEAVDDVAAPVDEVPEPVTRDVAAVDRAFEMATPDAAEAVVEAPEPAVPEQSDGHTEDSEIQLEESAPAAAGEDGVVVTETMAEVYVSQGLVHQARGVYEALLESDPGNAAIRLRLAELEAGVPEPRVETVLEDEVVGPAYSASATGGVPVRSFLKDLLVARPVPGTVSEDVVSEPSLLEEAFEDESGDGSSGAPTVPAGDEMSLASVFGDEIPQDEIPHTEAPQETAQSTTGEEAQDDSAADMSFDEFFGSTGKKAEDSEAASGEESEDDDEDFKAWLKSLKS